MTLEKLVKELLKKGLYGNGFEYDAATDSICYNIIGFAKSGVGTLKTDYKGEIHLLTRYYQDNIIENIKDFLDVAYDWDRHYCSKHINAYNTYSVGANWKKLYEEYGYDTSIFN